MDVRARCRELIEQRGHAPDSERLRALFDLNWEHRLGEYPEMATHAGVPGHNDRWTDLSVDAIERRKADSRQQRAVLDSIERAHLGESDALNFDLFARELDFSIEGARFKGEYLPVGRSSGPQTSLPMVVAMMPAGNERALQDIVSRLRAIPERVEQTITLMRLGMEAGITPPRVTLDDVPKQIQDQIVGDPAASPLLRPFGDSAPAARKEAGSVLLESVVPAYERLHEFVTGEYLPACRSSIAWTELPDGRDWYEFAVRRFTTTDLQPEEIHKIGLDEVARIRTQMETLVADSEFSGDFAGFIEFLRTDPRFFFEDATSLLVAYRDICKRIDAGLPKLFGRLPRLPYGVEAVPSYAERSATTAYYQPGSPQAGRPGLFFANTYDLRARPRWEMEALSVHEAVPGHHLQIALQQELELPEFRKHGGFTAFIEGWGLYSESLGEELGFYTDLYSKFGQLTYEMWRAIRLVVDTGMHALGWSRAQAIDYFKSNTGKSAHDITVEIDRYIGWAGQALAYKIGELKMKELRAHASAELGRAFDVRAFHDQLLCAGALPLDVLETRMRAWVATEVSKP